MILELQQKLNIKQHKQSRIGIIIGIISRKAFTFLGIF